MSEDNVNQNNDNVDDATTLKTKLEKSENEKAALEIKLREADDDLYSDDYLAYLQNKNQKDAPQGGSDFRGRISDYTEEQLQEMGTGNLPQLVKIIAGEVYTQIREEDNKVDTKKERDAHKKRVAKARTEIREFATKRPDFKEIAPTMKDLGDNNPNLNLKQLYRLAGGKYPDGFKKEESGKDKDKDKGESLSPPDTKPIGEGGMKGTDKSLSIREVIADVYQKQK